MIFYKDRVGRRTLRYLGIALFYTPGMVFEYIEIYLSVKFFCDRRRAELFDHEIYHEN